MCFVLLFSPPSLAPFFWGADINYVRLGGGAVEGALTATWDVLGDNKWKVSISLVSLVSRSQQVQYKDYTCPGRLT